MACASDQSVTVARLATWGACRRAALAAAPAVGEGQEFRTEFSRNVGSALLLGESVVHLNVLAAPA
jgi:hypothetical protein